MSQIVTQSVAADLVTILTTTGGVPATGILFSGVTALFRKEGAASFTAKTITALNFDEIGSGVYTISFTAAELNTLGSFTWVVNGAGLQQFAGIANVVATPVVSTAVSLQTCVVSGHLYDVQGAPLVGAAVSARVVGFPTLISNVGLSDDLVTSTTDSNGQFFLELVRLAQVDVMIPKINYRRNIVVPNAASADLFTGIP